MRTRVKICGVTRPDDAQLGDKLGVDFIGMVFAQSPRQVTPAVGRSIVQAINWARPVGLFMNQTAAQVAATVQSVPGLAMLQFHGNETDAFCAQFGLPFIKALSMTDELPAIDAYPAAKLLLLDTHAGSSRGGSGEVFDWSRVPSEHQHPLMVAGGLTAANVGQAIRLTRPFAVDVSSGIEIEPGQKDPVQLADFLGEVQRADSVRRD